MAIAIAIAITKTAAAIEATTTIKAIIIKSRTKQTKSNAISEWQSTYMRAEISSDVRTFKRDLSFLKYF